MSIIIWENKCTLWARTRSYQLWSVRMTFGNKIDNTEGQCSSFLQFVNLHVTYLFLYYRCFAYMEKVYMPFTEREKISCCILSASFETKANIKHYMQHVEGLQGSVIYFLTTMEYQPVYINSTARIYFLKATVVRGGIACTFSFHHVHLSWCHSHSDRFSVIETK